MFRVVMGMTGGEAPDESAPIQDGYLPLRSGSLSTRKRCRGCSRFRSPGKGMYSPVLP